MPTVSPEQVASGLVDLFKDENSADALYDAIDGTCGGIVLNADAARVLSPHYQTFEDCIAFTPATYPPCSLYIFNRLMRDLKRLPFSSHVHPPVIQFLAGGAASGKTLSIPKAAMKDAQLILDSNLASFEKAKSMIDAALVRGWDVVLNYVHRDFELALDGMIARARQTGRYISLNAENPSCLANLHFNSQKTFVRLCRE